MGGHNGSPASKGNHWDQCFLSWALAHSSFQN